MGYEYPRAHAGELPQRFSFLLYIRNQSRATYAYRRRLSYWFTVAADLRPKATRRTLSLPEVSLSVYGSLTRFLVAPVVKSRSDIILQWYKTQFLYNLECRTITLDVPSQPLLEDEVFSRMSQRVSQPIAYIPFVVAWLNVSPE